MTQNEAIERTTLYLEQALNSLTAIMIVEVATDLTLVNQDKFHQALTLVAEMLVEVKGDE